VSPSPAPETFSTTKHTTTLQIIHRHTTTYSIDFKIVLAELSLVLDYGFQKRKLVTNL